MKPPIRSLALLAGAASLSFEVLWIRQLTIETGGPMATFTIVVCSFMLGLSLGGAWFGRAMERSPASLHLLALAQTGAGLVILALAAIAAAGGMVRPLVVFMALRPGGVAFMTLEAALGGGVAVVVAFAMGGTVPLLLGAWKSAGSRARRIGSLAAFNAAGAAAGALACGFALLPSFGLIRSLVATGTVSLAVGLGAKLAAGPRAAGARGHSAEKPRNDVSPGGSMASAPPGPGVILPALLLMGAAVTALEIVWTRLAILTFGSSVQAASLVLAAVIAGLAAGNLCGGRLTRRRGESAGALGLVACGSALAMLVSAPVLGRLPLIAAELGGFLTSSGDTQAEALAMHASRFILMFAIVVVPCLLLGASFPIGCSMLPDRWSGGRVVGLASAFTSLGNLVGAPAAYFGVMSGMGELGGMGISGSRGCLLAAAGAASLAGLAAAGSGPRGRVRRLLALTTLATTFLVGRFLPWDPAILSSGPFLYGTLYRRGGEDLPTQDLIAQLHRRGEIIYAREGADALVTVRRLPGGTLSMQVNGKTDASTGGDMKTQMLTGHLPLLLNGRGPEPLQKALVVGLGSGVTLAAVLAHRVGSVEVVEISPEVADAARLFDQVQRGAMEDPRVTLTIGDARARLLAPATEPSQRFDVIASQPSNPWVAGQSLLFTREFYLTAREHLAPSGTMCQWVQGYGLDAEDFRSVVATFASVFPHVSMWEESTAGGDYLLLGSADPLAIDAAALRQRMDDSSIRADLALVEIDGPADLLSHFVAGDATLGKYAAGAVLQTEDRLSLEFNAPTALYRDTLGSILKSLEPWRTDPADLVQEDAHLREEVARRSRAARKEREWASGLGLMDAARSLDPEMMHAISYLRAGMRSHAVEVLREVAMRHPGDRTPHLVLGYLLMSRGERSSVEDAIGQLRDAVELDPAEPRARVYLARALYAAGRLPEALAENERAGALEPALAESASDRCAMLLATGDNPSAEAACLHAVSLDPLLAEAHANLGVAQARRARVEAAERSYRRALMLDPGLADARYNLAALLERQARSSEGLVVLEPLLSGFGLADAATFRLAARMSLESSDRMAARRYIDRSFELEPENEESRELERMLR